MSFWIPNLTGNMPSLQSTLQSTTNDSSLSNGFKGGHHPISCHGEMLKIHDDGSMECEHYTAGPEVYRNQAIVDASIALLIIEIAKDTL